jgi:hypothetical protein
LQLPVRAPFNLDAVKEQKKHEKNEQLLNSAMFWGGGEVYSTTLNGCVNDGRV